MGVPATHMEGSTTSGKVGAEAATTGSVFVLGIVKATGEVKGDIEVGHEQEKSTTFERTGLSQIVKEIGGSDFVVLVDDFHYMPRDVQSEAAKSLKEAVRLGVKVCTAAVRHRGDDLVRANPELRGRVRAIDLETLGNDRLEEDRDGRFCRTQSNCGLRFHRQAGIGGGWVAACMQLLCLNTCFVLCVRDQASNPVNVTLTSEQSKRYSVGKR